MVHWGSNFYSLIAKQRSSNGAYFVCSWGSRNNDHKLLGVNSLPVILGRKTATLVACLIMLVPQLVVIALFYFWGSLILALTLAFCVLLQASSMTFLIRDPEKNTPFFNMTGVLLYITGMMLSANGLYLMN